MAVESRYSGVQHYAILHSMWQWQRYNTEFMCSYELLPNDFKLPTLAQGWSYDGTSAREVTMSDVGKTQEYHMRGK